MSQKRIILRNMASNWVGFAVNAVVALFLTPFVLRNIGDNYYGLWAVMVSLTGYYGLLDLGIRGAVNQYVTRYWVSGDIDSMNRTMNTSVIVLSGLAALGLIIGGLAAIWAPDWLGVTGEQATQAQIAMLIMVFGVSIGLPMAAYGVATVASQRYDLSSVIVVFTRLLSAGMFVVVLKSGWGILGLAIVDTSIRLFDGSLRVALAYKLLPGLRFRLRDANRRSLSEMGVYGVYSFLSRLAGQLIDYSGILIVGLLLPIEAVTYYSIGANLIPYFTSVINAVTLTFTPVAISYHVRNDKEGLRNLMAGGTSGTAALCALVAGGMIFMGHDFLRLWVGPKYLLGQPYASSGTILVFATAAALTRMTISCGRQILFGLNEVKVMAILCAGEAICVLGLSAALTAPFGLVGTAIGSLVPAVLFQAGLLLVVLSRLGMGWRRSLPRLLGPGVLVLAATGVSWLLVRGFQPMNWFWFCAKALAVAAPGGGICALILISMRSRSVLPPHGNPSVEVSVPQEAYPCHSLKERQCQE